MTSKCILNARQNDVQIPYVTIIAGIESLVCEFSVKSAVSSSADIQLFAPQNACGLRGHLNACHRNSVRANCYRLRGHFFCLDARRIRPYLSN